MVVRYTQKYSEDLNLISVHLQAVRSWRENEIRPSAACNHSKDRHGLGCQQFSKAMVATIKWLKSLSALNSVVLGKDGEGGDVTTPKSLEKVITLPVYTTPNSMPHPPLLSEKQRDGIWFRFRLDLCACAFVCSCVHTFVGTFMCFFCVAQSPRGGDIFYKELSCQEAIVCAPRWQARSPGNGWCPGVEKNK